MTDSDEDIDLSDRFEAVDGLRGHCVCGKYFHYIGGLDVSEVELVCEDCGRRLQVEVSAEVVEHDPSNTYDEGAFREAVESHIRGEITEDELRSLWDYFGHPDKEYEETVEHLRSYLEDKVAKERIADQLGVSSDAVYTNYPEQMEEIAEGVVVVDGEKYAILAEFDEDDLDAEGDDL
ncbi:hypothetical protein [Halolamina salifodinae]|uniref:Uncharacterized protein n=1 Tax=Halolamina salifodinae TaxID=1202767 RepID=A0A8T4GV37_9EURY|nr:hypothetical protein [Halolamina salifodinae]MBP1986991.1 hypothetical protein [Halolamina salifodinae]